MTSDLEKKLQDLAQEYIGDVMCDSWTKKILDLFKTELAQAVKDKDRSVLITLLMSFIKMDDYKDPIFMYLKDGKTYQCKVKKFLAKLAQLEEEK